MEPQMVPPRVMKDEQAIKEVVSKVKSQGLFDQFRKDCIADVDTKPAYHNLLQRVESYVEHFLKEQKWSSVGNKNQLRETLRRQLNNSGMMHNGVERIIEQVVNPKILLGIKPKIDEAVCNHLGIDLKARQEEQQRKKQEQQRLLMQQQQQHLQQQQQQSKVQHNLKPGDGFDPATNQPPFGSMGPWGPGMANFPTPSVPGVGNPMPGMGGSPQCMPLPGVQPFSMMGNWPPGFNPAMQPMVPGQPMIPAFPPGAGVRPPVSGVGPFGANISPAAGSVPTSSSSGPTSVIPDLSKPPPGLTNTTASNRSPIVPPGIASINRAPPGSIPPPPGTVPVIPPPVSSPMGPPGTSPVITSRPMPTTPTIPALISHTLAKVSEDKLTPEKIAVFKTAAAFITKTVSNAQGTPGADLATMFSPRVLAEAMMEESGKPLSKHELRAARRKERMKEFERLKAERDSEEGKSYDEKREDKEDPLPPTHNLMDIFQGAEDVSDDEEALDMLMDVDETEDKNKTGIILSDESDKEGPEQPSTSQTGKRYNFAWNVDVNPAELSDVTVSSIHTSDMSSYEDLSSSDNDEEQENSKETIDDGEGMKIEDNTEIDAAEIDDEVDEILEKLAAEADEEMNGSAPLSNEDDQMNEEKKVDTSPLLPDSKPESPLCKETMQPQPPKPRKLLALSSHFSDSDDDETREERKARIAKEKEERYLKRQQRRAELEAKRKDRDEEKARLKEERKKQKELAVAESAAANSSALTSESSEPVNSQVQSEATSAVEQETASKAAPKKRKNKAELKEQLLQQKVMERKAALRRRRTRNRRYASDEFTTIFSERKSLNQGYTDDLINSEELVTFDGAVEVIEMTVDQECVVETVNEVIETSEEQGQSSELVLQCPSPYSDISDRSMSDSDKSDLSKLDDVSVDKVSSDEDLDEDFEEEEEGEATAAAGKEEEIPGSQGEGPSESMADTSHHDTSNSVASEPVSPRSRLSTPHSKSVPSLDELENTNCTPDDKSSQKMTPTPRVEEEKQSPISLITRLPTPLPPPGVISFVKRVSSDLRPPGVDDDEFEEEFLGRRAPVPKDIMADLELEPVSDEDSSLGGMSDSDVDEKVAPKDEEEGEERDSEEEVEKPPLRNERERRVSVQQGDRRADDENASDEGEIKSDSEEDHVKRCKPPPPTKKEEEDQRPVARRPIEHVDFGEAEKRARGSRVFYSESERRRSATTNVAQPGFRGAAGYMHWQASGTSSVSTYGSAPGRYALDTQSPARSKSPGAAFEVGSEASSHSRSSVRVRDDVPPPYHIEGVSRTHKQSSSISSTQGSSGAYKPPVSAPSPVSSSSSSESLSRHSRSRSKSRSSRARFSSRSSSSDSYSSGSQSTSRKRKRSSRKRWKRKRHSARNRSRDGSPVFPSHSPSSRMSLTDRPSPPHRLAEAVMPGTPSFDHTAMLGNLSSGNESISSDELPYFPDDAASKPSKTKHRRSSGEHSSPESSGSKPPGSPGQASISSSELIYSPSRQRVQSDNSDASSSAEQKSQQSKQKRRKSSTSRHSESSNDDPISPPRIETNVTFSPHRPSSPNHYPLLPDDMSGFQPPLPQDSPNHPPPLPCSDLPPRPPLPPDEPSPPGEDSTFPVSPPPFRPPSPSVRPSSPPLRPPSPSARPPSPSVRPPSPSARPPSPSIRPPSAHPPSPSSPYRPPSPSARPPSPPDEMEEGECPSSPEYREQSPNREHHKTSQFNNGAPSPPPDRLSPEKTEEPSKVPSDPIEENNDASENKSHPSSTPDLNLEDSSSSNAPTTQPNKNVSSSNPEKGSHLSSETPSIGVGELKEEREVLDVHQESIRLVDSNQDETRACAVEEPAEKQTTVEAAGSEIQSSNPNSSPRDDLTLTGQSSIKDRENEHDHPDPQLESKGLKRSSEDLDPQSESESSPPPSKRQKEENEDEMKQQD